MSALDTARALAARYAFAWIPLGLKTRLVRVPGVATLRRRVLRRVSVGTFDVEPRALRLRMRLDLTVHKLYLDFREAEGYVVDHLVGHVQPGQVALDVGAFIGYHALLFGRLAGPSGRVVSFEPFPPNQAHVLENAALNHLANVRVAGVALSDREGTFPLYVDIDPHTGIADARTSLLASRLEGREQEVVQARVCTLDTWMDESDLDRVDWIKVDVEGAELAVLRGMRETLRRFGPTVVIEFNDDASANEGRAFFAEVGYQARELGRAQHGVHLVASPGGPATA